MQLFRCSHEGFIRLPPILGTSVHMGGLQCLTREPPIRTIKRPLHNVVKRHSKRLHRAEAEKTRQSSDVIGVVVYVS